MTPAEDFFKFNPPLAWISRVVDPTPARVSRIPSVGRGLVDFFWNNPISYYSIVDRVVCVLWTFY